MNVSLRPPLKLLRKLGVVVFAASLGWTSSNALAAVVRVQPGQSIAAAINAAYT